MKAAVEQPCHHAPVLGSATLFPGIEHSAAGLGGERGWKSGNSQQLLGTTAFSKPFLPGSEKACLHESPLWSLLLNMPFENDARWDVCTFVITKTRLVFDNLCLLISQWQRREAVNVPSPPCGMGS